MNRTYRGLLENLVSVRDQFYRDDIERDKAIQAAISWTLEALIEKLADEFEP